MFNSLITRSVSAKLFLSVLFLIMSVSAVQAENLKPFFLADAASGDFAQTVTETKAKLTSAGFGVVGEYSPYKGANIIIVTSDALKKNAGATEFGGYGAVQRIAVTDMAGSIQVTYTNPVYMAAGYRMAGDLSDVAATLKGALGEQKTYGSEKGLTAKKLKKYHYMFGMPYFDDPSVLAKYASYDEAMQKVKTALAAKKGGVSKVYQLDIPGKKQTVIGVAMTEGMSDDTTIMTEVDFKDIRSTAHLPYEMLVHEDGKVYALHGKFRIALNFPDLSMMGKNSFMGIMASPDAIKKALSQAAGNSAN